MFRKLLSNSAVGKDDALDDVDMPTENLLKRHILVGSTIPLDVLLIIYQYLDLREIFSVSLVDRACFFLFFFRDVRSKQFLVIPKPLVTRNARSNDDIIPELKASSSKLKKEEKAYAPFEEAPEDFVTQVQVMIWKPLVLRTYPKFKKDLNVKNWLHVLRRRMVYKPPKLNSHEFLIDGCEWVYKCPLVYQNLKPVDYSKRFCEVCKEHVYYAKNAEQFEKHINEGHCVSFAKDRRVMMGKVRRIF